MKFGCRWPSESGLSAGLLVVFVPLFLCDAGRIKALWRDGLAFRQLDVGNQAAKTREHLAATRTFEALLMRVQLGMLALQMEVINRVDSTYQVMMLLSCFVSVKVLGAHLAGNVISRSHLVLMEGNPRGKRNLAFGARDRVLSSENHRGGR